MLWYLWRKMCCSTNYFLVRIWESFKRFVSLVVSTVEIFKIEIFRLRLCRVMNFVEIVETHQDCWNLSRRIEIRQNLLRRIKICWEISTLSRPFDGENDGKSRRIKKSQQENAKIHALINQDRDKLSRNAEILQSRLTLFGLDIDVSQL
jgi:hypothetical protein